MALTWRHLVGSTDRFGVEISLIEDPDQGQFALPEVSKSWGEFNVFVEGRNLCEAKDPTGVSLAGVRWYLLPLLRFFVHNWEPLMHQGRLPFRVPRSGTFAATQMTNAAFPPQSASPEAADSWHDVWWNFFTEHCLASAREGGLFPNVWFRRLEDDIEVSWDNDSNPAELPIRFSERQGAALIDAGEFASVVGEIIGATLDELIKRIHSADLIGLRRELDAIRRPTSDRRWLRHALLLHLRRNTHEAAEFARSLARRFPTLVPPDEQGAFAPSTLPSLVFASASPDITEESALLILDEFERSKAEHAQSGLTSVGENVPCPFYQPWISGHDLALRLREKLSLGFGRIDLDEVLAGLGISVRPIDLSDEGIRAISFVDEGLVPTILLNSRSSRTQRQWARAATLAHELCHLAFDRQRGTRLGIASGPWAPVRYEQRANAFAAMFLMPAPEVVAVFRRTKGDLNDRVKAVAKYFGASYRAAVEHLFSLDLIERYVRDGLLEDLDEYVL